MDPGLSLAAFAFVVSLTADPGAAPQASFAEAAGLTSPADIGHHADALPSSGVRRMPGAAMDQILTLSHGIVPTDSALGLWLRTSLDGSLSGPIPRKQLYLSLRDEKGETVASWVFSDAWPLRWDELGFEMWDDRMVIEHVEFAYERMTRSSPGR